MNWQLKKEITEQYGTQADFASKLGVSQSIVSEAVRGRRNLSKKEKTKWAKNLNTNPSELFKNV